MTSGLNIAIVCPACGGTGSVANVAVHHAKELSKSFQVTLVSDSFPDTALPGVESLKVTPRRFDYLRRFCHVPNEYAFARAVRDKLEMMHKGTPIDMIICHGHVAATLSAKPLKGQYGIPYALVTHGDIFDRPKGTYDWRLTMFYKAVTPYAYRTADLIIPLSPYMAEYALKRGGVAENIRVIPNGIDPSDIGLNLEIVKQANDTLREQGVLKLLYVGTLHTHKGIAILLSACDILNKRRIPFSLHIIGSGPLEAALKDFVKKSELSNKIIFLGKVDRKDLGPHYRYANLLIVPSLSDALPTVVLEALLSGVPVVGSHIGGIPFMIQHGMNGLLCKPDDPIALSTAIERLYRNPSELSSLSANAFPSVYPKFSWETAGEALICSINEVLSRRMTR